jgi:hypothetical protein
MELERAPGATVTGAIVRNDVASEDTSIDSTRAIAIAFLVSLFGSLLTYLILKYPLETYFVPRVIDPLWPIFAGGGFLLLAPLLVVILLVSMIGVSLGLILLAGSLTLLALAFVLGNMTAGVLASYIVTKKPALNTMTITIGAVITQALFFVPVIGPLLLLVLFCLTIGALVLILAAKIAHRR